ncbi:MAG TPA: SRPBCC family protein [Xanthomonadaceae bacterium]|jgi:uncharacterized protein YndB with AHSA1/START domain
MSDPDRSTYVYVTYIRTTSEKLWSALTTPEFIKKYWFGMDVDCDFKAGSPWKLSFEDGRVADDGSILESDPPRRLVIRWQNQWKPDMKAEGEARCTMELEPLDGAVKLTVTHEMARPDSKFIAAVAGGWPKILSNLKSLVETGAIVIA